MSSSCAANSEHVSRVVVVVGEGPAELVFCLRLYLPSLSISETEKVGTESRIVVIRRGLVRHYIHSTTCLPPSEGYFKETPSQRLKPAFGVSWNSRWGQSTKDTNQINCDSSPFLNRREKCSNEVTYDIFLNPCILFQVSKTASASQSTAHPLRVRRRLTATVVESFPDPEAVPRQFAVLPDSGKGCM